MKHIQATPIYWLLIPLLFFLSCQGSKNNNWFSPNPSNWPQIAMINEVWYEGGERYIHSSFEYAATGFLLRYEEQIYAATAKHVLWIAKPSNMTGVNPSPSLQRWIMHPKGNLADSVVLGDLINADSTEILQGPESTIQQRDWIVFKTKKVSSKIQALTPSFRQLTPGERIYFAGCPYTEPSCITGTGTVLRARGNRIILSLDEPNLNMGGASGSPLIDTMGQVVGIFSGTSVNPKDGKPAFYGISTHYLKQILENKADKNLPLISIADVLRIELEEGGLESASNKFHEIVEKEDHFFQYSVLPEEFHTVASELIDEGRLDDAIGILKLSLEDHYYFSRTHSLMGQAYADLGQLTSAKNALNIALQLDPNNQEAGDLLLKLESN